MKNSRLLKYIILIAAIGLIAAGIYTGEAQVVLSKATKICFECIGIG